MDGDRLIYGAENGLSRRAAFAVPVALGSTFALAAQPVQAQTMITTPADGLTAGAVKVKTKDGKEMDAYRAMPATGTGFGTILVTQEIFGVHAHIADLCRRFAKAGYYAIAPELFARQGDVSKLTDSKEILSKVVSKVPDAQVMSDLDASVAFAKKDTHADVSKLAITGFCWGGRITWLYAAQQPTLKSAVAWYGKITGEKDELHPRFPADVVTSLKAPVLGLYGGKDQGIPVDTVQQQAQALAASSNAAAKASSIHIYPDAGHAFFADYRPSFQQEAAEDGWKRTLDWFKSHHAK